MVKIPVLLLAAFVLVAMFSGQQASAQTSAAQFKGYAQLQNNIGNRIGLNGSRPALGGYVGNFELIELLGGWTGGFGTESAFHNADPNAVNMLVSYLAFDGFAAELASNCLPGGPPAPAPTPVPAGGSSSAVGVSPMSLDPVFQAKLMHLCAWPAASVQTDAVLSDFWLSLMGYDAPEAEYQAWRDFFLSPAFAKQNSVDTVKAMVLSITMNPYFLLKN